METGRKAGRGRAGDSTRANPLKISLELPSVTKPEKHKEYLSGVRAVTRFFKNHRIAPENSAFGVENRVYLLNHDKSVPGAVYERIIADLKASPEINDNRIAAQLQLQRELGLRKEEAFKFDPGRAVMRDGTVFIQHGTKGGRERTVKTVP